MEWEGNKGGGGALSESEQESDTDESDEDQMYLSYFGPASSRSGAQGGGKGEKVQVDLSDEVKVSVFVDAGYDEVISGGMRGDVAESLRLPKCGEPPGSEEASRICERNSEVYAGLR